MCHDTHGRDAHECHGQASPRVCPCRVAAVDSARASRLAHTTRAHAFDSRYADDLTFSVGVDDHRVVEMIICLTKRIVEDEGYKLHTRKKLRIMRRHDRQTVTGLVVNDGVSLPRRTRRWLRAVEHHMATGRRASLNDSQLQGWRALQRMIAQQTRPDGGV